MGPSRAGSLMGLQAVYGVGAGRDLGWCDHDFPLWGEHTLAMALATSPVRGAPASILGSELQGFGPSFLPIVYGVVSGQTLSLLLRS